MNRAAIGSLAMAAAMLFPNWAVAHVLSVDEMQLLHQVDDARVREVLPQVRECAQVPVTFRTQSMTQDQMEEACGILKEVDDRFHAKLRTGPDNPVQGDQNDRVEAIVFNSYENSQRYNSELFGYIGSGAFFYAEGDSYDPSNTARILTYKPDDVTELRHSFALEHEYVHYLDGRFIQHGNYSVTWWAEGLAEYISLADVVNSFAIKLIGDGTELPDLDSISKVSYGAAPAERIYAWPYLAVRFLFERHFDTVLDFKEFLRSGTYLYVDDYNTYFDASIQPLTDDFHRWLRTFTNIAVQEVESVTYFVEDADNITEEERNNNYVNLLEYFVSSRDLEFRVVNVSESNVVRILQVPGLSSNLYFVLLSIGRAEVTVTATAPDGQNAEQTFTVNVVEALQTRQITVRDAVSTEEGGTAINLASYFAGPALSEIEFTATSNSPDIALAAVRDGRLAITAVAVGKTEVTLRSEYYGRVTEQTFTVTVTDDCPPYLCRGFFNGWRWLLLEGGQATPGH